MSRSPLTGEWVAPTVAARRPFAVMLNNIKDAIPQSGISRTEVLYEAYVEGNTTRLMMINQNYDEYASYRTTDCVTPHNAFTTTENILAGMARKGISENLPAGFTQPLAFNQDDASQIVIEGGHPCTLFKPGFTYNKPELRYNAEDGLYYRYQFGETHIDLETGTQLAFKNIIVKYVDGYLFDNYTPVLTLEGSGAGLFISNGVAADVTWKKDSLYGQTKYYYPNGKEMVFVISNDDRKNVVVQ